MSIATVATCSLDQWALDFDGNFDRIVQSCQLAKQQGARYRLGPELEISGYGCEDHFLENDTCEHSIEILAKLLNTDCTVDMLCDFGLPMIHNSVRYNVRALCLNRRVLCIRPKQALAGDGNYREPRWFSRWAKPYVWEEHDLHPSLVLFPDAPKIVPFGDLYIKFEDCTVGVESCEELFAPESPHIRYGLNGVDIVGNGSGSHHQLRKLNTRVDLIRNATQKSGGVYLYANQTGCDGGRLGFDGCPLIALNGDVVKQGNQFTVSDVEVISCSIDLNAVRSYRSFSASRCVQASEARTLLCLRCSWKLCRSRTECGPLLLPLARPIPVRYLLPEEEIAFGPAVWMWDYLRRCGASGFFLPLSGGADSASTAAIAYSMCRMVAQAVANGDEQVTRDAMRITRLDRAGVANAKLLAQRILHTAYLGTSNSSEGTRNFASNLTEQIGNYHLFADIESVINSILALFLKVTGKTPKYKVHGGSYAENQALQNIQARFRMVFSYMLAQLLPWVRFGPESGFLIVLGSANVDEGLRGYLTKYDCSSADINPIGGISKVDLKKFLAWGSRAEGLGLPALKGILEQAPTAELEPITASHTQTDEEDMGCSYDELGWFGRLRKNEQLGPVSMFRRLVDVWPHLSARAVADKVKFLFRNYSINRHKMTTITPSYHAENYSPDDNRYDFRQFLYNVKWPFQFRKIDEEVCQEEARIGKL